MEDFAPFTLMHVASVAFFGFLMAGACWLGRCWRETPREARFRRLWGWMSLSYSTWYTIFYLLPKNFDWTKALPCQLCDLAAFTAGIAMVTHARWARTLLYFWGIGLSTQAFISPTVQYGVGSIWFWLFWINHTIIVGSAMYEIVVCHYRPTLRELWFAIVASYAYVMTMFFLNVWLTMAVGEPINYGYVGDTHPHNPTIIDKLGPWPARVAILCGIVIGEFVVLWGLWPLAAKLGWRWAAPRQGR
jgi:hypothetical integral membrane protein (TIGR02206 family)